MRGGRVPAIGLSRSDIIMAFDATTFEIGKNKIEVLSDGIFAIVMTLLILEIRVPSPTNAPNVEVAPALIALWPKFVSYLVTFVSLGCFWICHHIMYHAIRRAECTPSGSTSSFLCSFSCPRFRPAS